MSTGTAGTGTAGLVVLAEARWPEPGDGAPPALPGFVLSSFSPLVAAVADRCLRRRHGGGPPAAPDTGRTALVIVSAGDRVGDAHVAATVAAGRRLGPLSFFQSVPNSVAGAIAGRWGLDGPVVCLAPTSDAPGRARAEALTEAELLLADIDGNGETAVDDDGAAEADEALLVLAEQGTDDRPGDHATALLVGRCAPRTAGCCAPRTTGPCAPRTTGRGGLR